MTQTKLVHQPKRKSLERYLELETRRAEQLKRQPDQDARLRYFSKNSLPEYRK